MTAQLECLPLDVHLCLKSFLISPGSVLCFVNSCCRGLKTLIHHHTQETSDPLSGWILSSPQAPKILIEIFFFFGCLICPLSNNPVTCSTGVFWALTKTRLHLLDAAAVERNADKIQRIQKILIQNLNAVANIDAARSRVSDGLSVWLQTSELDGWSSPAARRASSRQMNCCVQSDISASWLARKADKSPAAGSETRAAPMLEFRRQCPQHFLGRGEF